MTDVNEAQSLFETYAQKVKSLLSTHSFVNIFIWQDFFNFRFVTINQNLCVFAENEMGSFMYLPPLGERFSDSTIEECFALMEETNHGNGVSRIENVDQRQMALFSFERFVARIKSYDYCYFRQDIVDLRGNSFKARRALYNFFVKHYSYHFLFYDKTMQMECLQLYDKWAEHRLQRHQDPVFRQMIEENRLVHQKVLEFYLELDLVGRVVTVDGVIKGYTFGYSLNENIFCILLEITDLEIKGLPVYIFREFCRDVAIRGYKFINTMDDFSMPNVEKTKLSYQPIFLLPSYTIQEARRSCSNRNLLF